MSLQRLKNNPVQPKSWNVLLHEPCNRNFNRGGIPKSYIVDVKQMQKLSVLENYRFECTAHLRSENGGARDDEKAKKIAVSELLGCVVDSWGFKCQNLLNVNFITTWCLKSGVKKKPESNPQTGHLSQAIVSQLYWKPVNWRWQSMYTSLRIYKKIYKQFKMHCMGQWMKNTVIIFASNFWNWLCDKLKLRIMIKSTKKKSPVCMSGMLFFIVIQCRCFCFL